MKTSCQQAKPIGEWGPPGKTKVADAILPPTDYGRICKLVVEWVQSPTDFSGHKEHVKISKLTGKKGEIQFQEKKTSLFTKLFSDHLYAVLLTGKFAVYEAPVGFCVHLSSSIVPQRAASCKSPVRGWVCGTPNANSTRLLLSIHNLPPLHSAAQRQA